MTLLARYLLKLLLTAVGMSLLGLVLLFGFFDFIGELNDIQADGYTAGYALMFVALNLPARTQELLPIACLIGALVSLSQLAANSEFSVIRASGLSGYRIAGYMLALGLSLGLGAFLLGEYVTPAAERLAQQVKVRSADQIVAQQFRSGLWAKDGERFINIRQLLPDGRLSDIRIYEFDQDFLLRTVRYAQSGGWSDAGHWELQGITETSLAKGAVQLRKLATQTWATAVTPALISALVVHPEHMAAPALRSYIGFLKTNQQKTTRYELALWNKFAFPLAAPIMLLLALPFGYLPPRQRGVGGRILIGILIGLGFHLVNRLFGNLGLLNDWPAPISALAPLTLFFTLAVLALWSVERR